MSTQYCGEKFKQKIIDSPHIQENASLSRVYSMFQPRRNKTRIVDKIRLRFQPKTELISQKRHHGPDKMHNWEELNHTFDMIGVNLSVTSIVQQCGCHHTNISQAATRQRSSVNIMYSAYVLPQLMHGNANKRNSVGSDAALQNFQGVFLIKAIQFYCNLTENRQPCRVLRTHI